RPPELGELAPVLDGARDDCGLLRLRVDDRDLHHAPSARRRSATVSPNARSVAAGSERSPASRPNAGSGSYSLHLYVTSALSRPSATVSLPSSGVCGSRTPQISRSSPSISPARASEPASSSLPSLPSCRPVGYQSTVPLTASWNAARNARWPPV